MKKYVSAICVLLVFIAGCMQQKMNENQFKVVWKEYLTREFRESFDEKQSAAQRKKILDNVLNEYRIPMETFTAYMKENHPDKYRTIFFE